MPALSEREMPSLRASAPGSLVLTADVLLIHTNSFRLSVLVELGEVGVSGAVGKGYGLVVIKTGD